MHKANLPAKHKSLTDVVSQELTRKVPTMDGQISFFIFSEMSANKHEYFGKMHGVNCQDKIMLILMFLKAIYNKIKGGCHY